MALIQSPRHTPADLREWARLWRMDMALAHSPRMDRLIARALDTLRAFHERQPDAVVMVSWGKDSVVTAHLAWRAGWRRMVHALFAHMSNPDNAAVRDAFLRLCPYEYREIECGCDCPADVPCACSDRRMREAIGTPYMRTPRVSGIRSEESSARRMRVARWGEASEIACAPLARWRTLDVFAYLAREDLPIHPVYAMSYGGSLPRERLRVDHIGGEPGIGFGRREWERRYYGDVVRALDARQQ